MTKIKSDGGSTSYYDLPEGATTLNDLIEYKEMSFALGNIFKAAYRLGSKDGADELYDINKILYFAERLKAKVERERQQQQEGQGDLFEWSRRTYDDDVPTRYGIYGDPPSSSSVPKPHGYDPFEGEY